MKWCARCVLPDTRPNLVLGPDGVCNACTRHVMNEASDWEARAGAFRDVVAAAKGRGAEYDCVIPVSGGKDSTWQVVTCLEHGLRPLAVTWRTPGRTEVGAMNLANLIELGVDHVDFQVNPRVERVFVWEALQRLGDPAIPMHLALFNIPLKISARFGIPLVVWGENSAMEYGTANEARVGFSMDDEWLRSFGVSGGTTAADWVMDGMSRADLTPYFGPSSAELVRQGVLAVFLGYYFHWDVETSLAVATAHGFRRDERGPRTGLYDYADIDDDFISIHHHLKWYKFGFTRLFDNLSLEIRNGRVSREDAIAVIRQRGDQTPWEDIDRFCAWLGVDRGQFLEVLEHFRNPDVWERAGDTWRIRGFLIEDWDWR